MTNEELAQRIRNFFIRYETELEYWNPNDFDPVIDFFDLEDMLACRYWLHEAEKRGILTDIEKEMLHVLDKKFFKSKIDKFVKEHFPGVYEKWIEEVNNET